MALIHPSALISDITGTIGGTTFQRTQGGLSMRNASMTRNPNNSLQQFNKTGITLIQNAWVALTQAERNVWNQYAVYRSIKQKKSSSLVISGQQIFIRENQLRVSMTGYGAIYDNPIHTVPVFAYPPAPLTCTGISLSGEPQSVFYDTNIDNTIQGIILKLSRPLRESNQSRYEKRVLMKFNTANGISQLWPTYYATIYGITPSIGQFISVEIGVYDSTLGTFTISQPQLIEIT